MTTNKHLSAAIREAESKLDSTTEPLAVIEWNRGHRFYEVKAMKKALVVADKYPEAKIVGRFYPGTLDGVA